MWLAQNWAKSLNLIENKLIISKIYVVCLSIYISRDSTSVTQYSSCDSIIEGFPADWRFGKSEISAFKVWPYFFNAKHWFCSYWYVSSLASSWQPGLLLPWSPRSTTSGEASLVWEYAVWMIRIKISMQNNLKKRRMMATGKHSGLFFWYLWYYFTMTHFLKHSLEIWY